MAFGESVDPTAAIRGVLDSYPFSVGLFRELLQNSDDASASKQVLILDHRSHPTVSLYDPRLAEMQGPALLAYNDKLFSENDWNSLRNIHRSSKKMDTSKIGKYGIGFRSCYHVTDGPQILSGTSLAILDPCHKFSRGGGVKFDFIRDSQFVDQLSSFDPLLSPSPLGLQFPGSIIRLPLRTVPGIGAKPVSPSEIRQLLKDFIDNEIRICLLFLQNVMSIEVLEIDVDGKRSDLALSTIVKIPKVTRPLAMDQTENTTSTYVVETRIDSGPSVTEKWRIQHTEFPQSDTKSRLCQRAGCDPSDVLSTHKLRAAIGLAIPLSILTPQGGHSGRLYTYLPLPLPTGFPVHIHSLFALTQSRQNLRNREEKGLVRGSADSVLVDWNQLLFDVYIPRAWMSLLTTLVGEDGLTDVFRAWPPAQGNQSGDAGYWKDLPANLLECIANSGARIWPVVTPRNKPPCLELGSVIVAAKDKLDLAVLQALATFGLKITCPPTYIYELLSRYGGIKLTPRNVHDTLLRQVPELELPLNTDNLPATLQYLLADGDLTNLVGLPLIPLANGQHISLDLSGSSIVYTMLEKGEFEIFRAYENKSIVLHLLQDSVATILRAHGPTVLNLQPLIPETVVRYLKMDPSPHGIVLQTRSVNYRVVECLSKFWTWMGGWHLKNQLYPLIKDLHLLPSVNGLKRTSSPIYTELGVDPTLISSLSKIGITFLHPDFSESAQKVVSSFGRLNDFNDISDLLHSLDLDYVSTVRLEEQSARTLLGHFGHARRGSLGFGEHPKLRKLPIFPLVQAGSRNATTVWGSIPEEVEVKSIFMASLRILPFVPGTVFVDGSLVESSLLKILDPSASGPLLEHDILSMALQHFAAQSVQTKVAFLEYMAKHRDEISPSMLNTLRRTPFVVVTDGSLQSPESVVDPQSVIGCLYLTDDNRFPQMADKHQEALIDNLRLLRAIQDTLTADIVMERVQFISSTISGSKNASVISALSRRLLELLSSPRFNCSSLAIDQNLKWLPVQNHLLSPKCCHDKDSHQRELFDHVLPLLDIGFTISPSLRLVLGWDKPLPFHILAEQLLKVLDLQHDEAYRRIEILIKELSERLHDLDDDNLHRLRTVVESRPWVPVSCGYLADTSHAVFSGASPTVGFYEIPFIQRNQREFLLRMGCSEKPMLPAIIQDLKVYQGQPPTSGTAKKAILLLKLLPPDISDDISDEKRREILVPDGRNILFPVDSVFYNDIGNKACLINPNNIYIAHPAIHDGLATTLRMSRLGLRFTGLKQPGRDMGEQPTTTIRNKLEGYKEKQLLTEFIANAIDAGATEFGILIDEYQHTGLEILSRGMDKFQACSSLVIYNNAVFTDKDFDGICETGIGGKRERTDSIGQFGSGALTMFHFSEVVTIVSGSQVVFLNPSKDHLPLGDRVLSLSLDHMNTYYPDQLASLGGVFQFEQSSSVYTGTIFRLPLRNLSHISRDSISETEWTARRIDAEIIRPFLPMAHECLLFTKLQTMEFFHRDRVGTTRKEGTITAIRQDEHIDTRYRSEIVHITRELVSRTPPRQQEWNVVSTSVSEEDFPRHFSVLATNYRLRSPIVLGLAARLHPPEPLSGNFFSTLPLPVSNGLPVHLTAPFILSSDRRQIRSDMYDDLVSNYNQWLLGSAIPPLYVFLLADLLRHQGHNKQWWPGDAKEGSEHNLTSDLVSAFYQNHVHETTFPVFLSKYAQRPLLPKEVVMVEPRSPAVLKNVLEILKPHELVSLPTRLRKISIQEAKLRSVTPLFIKDEILRYPDNFASQLTLVELQELLDFICKKETNHLIGLPLLPLADGTFAKFEESSSCTEMYIAWSSSLFLRKHLVHPEFCVTAYLDLGLNITNLNVSGIQRLVQEVLPQGDERGEMAQSDQGWINRFWSEYSMFQLDKTSLLDCVSQFPLVRTTRQGKYISISKCKSRSSVILSSLSFESLLWDCFTELGLTVVDRYSRDLPQALREILQPSSDPRGFPHFQFDHALLALDSPVGLSVEQRFQRLNTTHHQFFATWACSQMLQSSKDLRPIARRLPIWPSTHRLTHQPLFLPATDVAMLPVDITPAMVKPFINTPVTQFSAHLKYLDVCPMSWHVFFDKLHFPGGILHRRDIQRYLRLLTTVVNHDRDVSWVLVPNCNSVMCRSDNLYARDRLFLAAFGSVSQRFIVGDLRDLEPRLKAKFGLKCQSQLDLEMFRECASAIDDDSSGDRVQRAAVVFQTYCQDLPLHVNEGSGPWESLDNLKFIPRVGVRSRWSRDVSAYVRNNDLLGVVAPKDIVLPKYEAIVWTQRVLSIAEPHPRIFIANPNFGLPTIQEVVRHLYILACQVSTNHPQGVLKDLLETYTWLDEHSDEAGSYMIQHNAEKLFLNVADPEAMAWEWCSARDLLLGIEETMRHFHPVQKFLLPFKKLLVVSGVQQLTDPTLPDRAPDNDSEISISLQSMRSAFCEMRKERQLTDVLFHPVTDSEDDEPRNTLYAHRAYLASCSRHFKHLFTGECIESHVTSGGSYVKVPVEGHSSRCVEIILKFLYEGVVDAITVELAELLEVMELSNYWEIMGLHKKIQYRIIPLINPETVDEIEQRAQAAEASDVVEKCRKYWEDNRTIIEEVQDDYEDEE